MGTGPLVRLCLDSNSVHVLVDEMGRGVGALHRKSVSASATQSLDQEETVALHPELGRALGLAGSPAPRLQPLVMFPGKGAVSLEEALASVQTLTESATVAARSAAIAESSCDDGDGDHDERRVLIVLDGTWQQAKKLWRRHHAALASAQRVVIVGCGTSRFAAIRRREPALGCVSTLEALSAALGMMESLQVAEVLLAAFDAMVLTQSRFVPAALAPEDYYKQQAAVPSATAPLRAARSQVTAPQATARVRAYAVCLTQHCPLTGKCTLVPVGIENPTLGAQAATRTLSQVRRHSMLV